MNLRRTSLSCGNSGNDVNIPPDRAGRMAWRVTRRLLQAAILCVIGWYAVAKLDWTKLSDVDLNWSWVFAALLVHLCYLTMYLLLWQALTVLHDSAVSLPHAATIWGFSLIGKYAPLKVGMILLRVFGYQRIGHRSKAQIAVCCYLEWFMSLYAAIIVGAILAIFLDVQILLPNFRFICAVLLAVLLPFLWPSILSRVFGWIFRILKLPETKVQLSLRGLIGFLAGYCAAWMVLGFSLLCAARGVRFIQPLPWSEACMAYALAGFLGIIAVFAPAGLGVRDGAMILLLSSQLGVTGAVVVGVLVRVVSLLVELAAVGGAWLSDPSLQQLLRWKGEENLNEN